MGDCRICIHFRRPIRASEALIADCGGVDAPIQDTTAKLREEECKLEVSELTEKKDLMLRDYSQWREPPRMTDYCAVDESQGVFHIYDLKNAGQKCRDFSPGKPQKRDCATCIRRSPPFGRQRDLQVAQVYMTAAARFPMFQSSNQQMLNDHNRASAQAMANQIFSAFSNNGILPERPEYLSVCKEFSKPTEHYTVCVIKNASNSCVKWRGKDQDQDRHADIELIDGQLQWTPAGNVELRLDGSILRLRYQDPNLGPPKLATYDLSHLSDDGASRLVLPDGTRLPLLIRYRNCIAHIRHIRVDTSERDLPYPAVLPVDDSPKQFRARRGQYFWHPNQQFSLTVSGSSLVVYGRIGLATSFDLTHVPPDTWMVPTNKEFQYPLRYRLDWLDWMCKAYAPWVDWLD